MKSHRQSVQINFINVICNYVEFFHATCVNTTVCSYIFISLFTSLSLCCLHLLFGVFLEELAEVWTTLHFSAFKITLSVRPLKNKNTELKRLFTMKIRHFSLCFFNGMSVGKGLSCIVESWARIEIPNGVQKISSYSNFNHGATFSTSNNYLTLASVFF